MKVGPIVIIMTALSRHIEIARTCSNVVADRFEAKFHYAILVADRSGAGRRPARSC